MIATAKFVVEVDYNTEQQEGDTAAVQINLGQTIAYLLVTERDGLTPRVFPVRAAALGDQES